MLTPCYWLPEWTSLVTLVPISSRKCQCRQKYVYSVPLPRCWSYKFDKNLFVSVNWVLAMLYKAYYNSLHLSMHFKSMTGWATEENYYRKMIDIIAWQYEYQVRRVMLVTVDRDSVTYLHYSTPLQDCALTKWQITLTHSHHWTN